MADTDKMDGGGDDGGEGARVQAQTNIGRSRMHDLKTARIDEYGAADDKDALTGKDTDNRPTRDDNGEEIGILQGGSLSPLLFVLCS